MTTKSRESPFGRVHFASSRANCQHCLSLRDALDAPVFLGSETGSKGSSKVGGPCALEFPWAPMATGKLALAESWFSLRELPPSWMPSDARIMVGGQRRNRGIQRCEKCRPLVRVGNSGQAVRSPPRATPSRSQSRVGHGGHEGPVHPDEGRQRARGLEYGNWKSE